MPRPTPIPTAFAITSPSRASRPTEKTCRHSARMPNPRRAHARCHVRCFRRRSKSHRNASHAYPITCSSFIEGDVRTSQPVATAYPGTLRSSHSTPLAGISAPSIKSDALRERAKAPIYLCTTGMTPCGSSRITDSSHHNAVASIADNLATGMLGAGLIGARPIGLEANGESVSGAADRAPCVDQRNTSRGRINVMGRASLLHPFHSAATKSAAATEWFYKKPLA